MLEIKTSVTNLWTDIKSGFHSHYSSFQMNLVVVWGVGRCFFQRRIIPSYVYKSFEAQMSLMDLVNPVLCVVIY